MTTRLVVVGERLAGRWRLVRDPRDGVGIDRPGARELQLLEVGCADEYDRVGDGQEQRVRVAVAAGGRDLRRGGADASEQFVEWRCPGVAGVRGSVEFAGRQSAGWQQRDGDREQVVGLGGTIATSSTLPAEPAAWQIGTVQTLYGGGGGRSTSKRRDADDRAGSGAQGTHRHSCPNVLCTMSVEGALSAVGSSGSPITFTSINDNSVGGGGGAGSPAAGDWYGILATGVGIDRPGARELQLLELGCADEYDRVGDGQERRVRVAVAAGGRDLRRGGADASEQFVGGVAQGWPAFEVQSSSLDAGRLGGNSATGTGEQMVGLGGTIATARRFLPSRRRGRSAISRR